MSVRLALTNRRRLGRRVGWHLGRARDLAAARRLDGPGVRRAVERLGDVGPLTVDAAVHIRRPPVTTPVAIGVAASSATDIARTNRAAPCHAGAIEAAAMTGVVLAARTAAAVPERTGMAAMMTASMVSTTMMATAMAATAVPAATREGIA